MKKRKICVVTGSRAEYGILYWLLKEIKNEPDLELQLIATGTHLSPEFGLTFKEIEQDGFTIDKRVEVILSSDTEMAIAKSIGLGCMSFAEAYQNLKPDMLVILGDRYEIFSSAMAAMVSKIPIAHIHGGESSEGVIDEPIRHSITKMSHLHFVSTQKSADRIKQMGEESLRVFNFGAPALEGIERYKLLSKESISKELDIDLDRETILITYHPVTLDKDTTGSQFKNILKAIDGFKGNIILTLPNADTGGRAIIDLIAKFEDKHSNSKSFASLGKLRYLSLLRYVDVMMGNSSSGLIEAPSFKLPVVNIGDRQRGRVRANNVIDCGYSVGKIKKSLKKALSSTFKTSLKNLVNPYKKSNTSKKIVQVLKKIEINDILTKKKFIDFTQALNVSSVSKDILVISPHPDDETFGCGGTILKHIHSGDNVYWLIVTKVFKPAYPEKILTTKSNEVKQINQLYGFKKFFWLDFKTTRLDDYARSEIMSKIEKVLKEVNPDIIYTVGEGDVHSDHKIVFETLISTLKSFYRKFKCKKIYVYETLSSTDAAAQLRDKAFLPTTFIDISLFINEKIEAVEIYKTEKQAYPLPRSVSSVKALAKHRGGTIGVEYAEAFMLVREVD